MSGSFRAILWGRFSLMGGENGGGAASWRFTLFPGPLPPALQREGLWAPSFYGGILPRKRVSTPQLRPKSESTKCGGVS